MTYYDTSYPPSLWAPPVPPPAAPTLATVTPNTAVAGATGVSVTLAGTGFTPTSTARVGATSLPTVYVSPTELTATIATVPAANTYSVTVVNENGTSNGRPFTVTAAQGEPTAGGEPEPTGYDAKGSPEPPTSPADES